jgi:hypothetical protein
LKECADLEKTENYLEWKRFFQKIGSNPKIKDKTVSIHWGELWDFVAFAKANRDTDCARIASRYAHDFGTFGQVPLGEQKTDRTQAQNTSAGIIKSPA